MTDEVLAWMRHNDLAAPGTRVVCAVSGGADSMCMLHVLLQLAPVLGIRVEAAHFNHRLRGAESDADQSFVRAQCRALGVALHEGSGDVRALAAQTGSSLEEAARTLRYRFLAQFSPCVATAHTMDDNLETVLLNLTRGTGLRGLCGIPVRRGIFIRPMLAVTRAQVEEYLAARALPFRTDSSNLTPDMRRNRIRQSVLPLLRAENPALAQTVFRMTQVLAREDAYLTAQADGALQAAAVPGGVSCGALRALPEPVRKRAVAQLLRRAPVRKLSARHITQVDALLISDDPSAQVSLPDGLCARRDYDRLCIGPEEPAPSFTPVRVLPDGATPVPELGLRIVCRRAEAGALPQNTVSTFVIRCDPMDKSGPIELRPRRPGDAMRLPGGTKSLRRLLMDRKIPRAARGLVPVLADSRGILGVGGIGVNLDRAARSGERAVVIQIEQMKQKEDSQV